MYTDMGRGPSTRVKSFLYKGVSANVIEACGHLSYISLFKLVFEIESCYIILKGTLSLSTMYRYSH